MSRWYDSEAESQREARRNEQRQFEANVYYEVWRAGGNPDRINPDRVDDAFWNSRTEEAVVEELMRQQIESRQSAQEEEPPDLNS